MRLADWSFTLAALAIIPLGGCSGEKVDLPSRAKVTGVVTHNGSPVEGADVTFVPTGHKHAASGRTDATGTYTLMTFEAGDGAVPGDYKVIVSKTKVMSDAAPASDDAVQTVRQQVLLPLKYAAAETSGLVASVKEGTDNKFDFALEGDLSKANTTPKPKVRTGE
jgi:hypothetical protein